MAKTKDYSSILDQMLDDGVAEAEMKDARKRGDDLSDLTIRMSEDGLFTRHVHASAEAQRTIIAKKLGDDNILDEVALSMGEAKANKDGLAHSANEKAVMDAIDALLKQGVHPVRIQAALDKCAELNLWNRQFSTDHLNRRIGELGMNYLQPNAFMKQIPDTYERAKPGKLGSAHVAVEGDETLGLGDSKFGGNPRKRARAVEIGTADGAGAPAPGSPRYERTAAPTRGAVEHAKTAGARGAGDDFDAGAISAMHAAGKSLKAIFDECAARRIGDHKVSKAFHEYANSFRAGTKFASADVDFLRAKFGIRGLQAAAAPEPLHRMAYDSGKPGGKAKDGNELLNEFELTGPQKPPEVEFTGDYPDVEAGQVGGGEI